MEQETKGDDLRRCVHVCCREKENPCGMLHLTMNRLYLTYNITQGFCFAPTKLSSSFRMLEPMLLDLAYSLNCA